jgi:hypothetical protein
MKERLAYSGLAFVFFAYGLYEYFVYAIPPKTASVIAFGCLISCTLWILMRVYQRWNQLTPAERSAQPILGELRSYFTVLLIFSFLDFLARGILPTLNYPILLVSTVHWFVHIFLYLSFIIGLRVSISFWAPKWKTRATLFTGLIAVGTLIAFAIHPDAYQLVPGTNEYALISHLSVRIPTTALALCMILGGAILAIRALFMKDPVVRRRAFMMGLGFAVVIMESIATQTHNSFTSLFFILAYTSTIYFLGMSTLSVLGSTSESESAAPERAVLV